MPAVIPVSRRSSFFTFFILLLCIFIAITGWAGYIFATHHCVNENYTVSADTVTWNGSLLIGADPTSFCARGDIIGVDSERAYVGNELVEGADPATFRRIGDHFFADAQHVYWYTTKIPDVIPDDFNVLGGSYSTTSTAVYYETSPIPTADTGTIKYLGYSYARDAFNSYNEGVVTSNVPELPVREETAGMSGEFLPSLWKKFADLYMHATDTLYNITDRRYTGQPPVQTMESIILDTSPVEVISYTSAGGKFFYGGTEFAPIDPSTFKALSNYYAKDLKAAYYQGSILEGANGATFDLLKTAYSVEVFQVAADKMHVYVGFDVVEGLNPRSVKVRGFYLFGDTGVFYNTVRIPGTEKFVVEDFMPLEPAFVNVLLGKDAILAFGKIFPIVDRQNTRVLGGDSAWTDGIRVYYNDQALEGADPLTYVYYNNSHYSKDGTSVFYGDQKVGGDAVTLKIISTGFGGYAKTDSYVAHDGTIIAGADPKTFEIIDQNNQCARDKSRYYLMGRSATKGEYDTCGQPRDIEIEYLTEDIL